MRLAARASAMDDQGSTDVPARRSVDIGAVGGWMQRLGVAAGTPPAGSGRLPCGTRRHGDGTRAPALGAPRARGRRSEEHTSELQSLMRISYAVFCFKKK